MRPGRQVIRVVIGGGDEVQHVPQVKRAGSPAGLIRRPRLPVAQLRGGAVGPAPKLEVHVPKEAAAPGPSLRTEINDEAVRIIKGQVSTNPTTT